ncbi:MAG: hypothetical protein IID13_07965, partial [Candidatus Marinimicrobia bacterium]|nr:hypothetical protein [Candidatus Neomarinimicrobiota bacterium]
MDTKLNDPHAERHLRQGFLRRLFQINSALEEVRRLTEAQSSEPLSHETSTLLDIYLGSYYINLSGALDNLAWMLAWEFQLTDTLSESDFAARRFCNLFREAFITALATNYPDLASYLADEPIRNWYSEIRNLRDPIAHRIPLLFVKGTLDEAEGIEYQKAYERRDEAIKRSTESFAT